MIGAFVALDLFLFYVFWELMLVPMYLMIGIWGGADKIKAALKFFLYTMAGSVLMLAAILYLVWTHQKLTGAWSFDYLALPRVVLPRHVADARASGPSRSRSSSRCRCGRCTPGCRTRTCRRRPAAR